VELVDGVLRPRVVEHALRVRLDALGSLEPPVFGGVEQFFVRGRRPEEIRQPGGHLVPVERRGRTGFAGGDELQPVQKLRRLEGGLDDELNAVDERPVRATLLEKGDEVVDFPVRGRTSEGAAEKVPDELFPADDFADGGRVTGEQVVEPVGRDVFRELLGRCQILPDLKFARRVCIGVVLESGDLVLRRKVVGDIPRGAEEISDGVFVFIGRQQPGGSVTGDRLATVRTRLGRRDVRVRFDAGCLGGVLGFVGRLRLPGRETTVPAAGEEEQRRKCGRLPAE